MAIRTALYILDHINQQDGGCTQSKKIFLLMCILPKWVVEGVKFTDQVQIQVLELSLNEELWPQEMQGPKQNQLSQGIDNLAILSFFDKLHS